MAVWTAFYRLRVLARWSRAVGVAILAHPISDFKFDNSQFLLSRNAGNPVRWAASGDMRLRKPPKSEFSLEKSEFSLEMTGRFKTSRCRNGVRLWGEVSFDGPKQKSLSAFGFGTVFSSWGRHLAREEKLRIEFYSTLAENWPVVLTWFGKRTLVDRDSAIEETSNGQFVMEWHCSKSGAIKFLLFLLMDAAWVAVSWNSSTYCLR